MAGLGERASYQQRAMGTLLVVTVLLGVLGLPVAVWLDLQILSERVLRMQASEASRIIDAMRNFYGSDVFGRVLQSPEPVRILQSPEPVMVTHKYRDIAGAIPIPATLSIELGKRISAQDGSVKYRFVSDMPFKGREPWPG
jgi:adenylate cyclase